MYKISEFSKLVKLSTKTLRYYEQIGLLKPYMIDDVIIPIKDLFKGKIVISLVAGYNYDRYAVFIGSMLLWYIFHSVHNVAKRTYQRWLDRYSSYNTELCKS